MRKISGVTVGIVVAVLVLLGLVENVAAGTLGELPGWAKPWVWVGLAVLAVAAVLVELSRYRRDEPAPAATGLEDVAAMLAVAVSRQWQAEQQLWQVHDPYPLPVRWEPGPAEVSDHPANIGQALPGADPGPLDLAGRLDEIVTVYQRVPSERLVVLGRAGAGKTILALRLVTGLLATRTRTGRVPVVFNLSTWDPTTTPLPTWLAARLIEDQPSLAAPAPDPAGGTLATVLLEGHILPVLDGFDEIATGLRSHALRALNRTTMPLLLTSRSDEYASAVVAADVLTAAAVVTLTDLSVVDLTIYLNRASPPTNQAGTRWAPVLAALTADPPTPEAVTLTAALATPLMVYLARTIYSDTPGHDPAELLDPIRFPTAKAIEDYLLDAFIPAVYQQPHPTQTGLRKRPWDDPTNAHRWHTYLATHLHRLNTQDLAWWQLRDTVPRTVRVLFIAPFWWLGIGLIFGLSYGFAIGLGLGLVLGTLAGLLSGFEANGPQPRRTPFQLRLEAKIRRLHHTPFRLRSRLPALLKAFVRRLATGLIAGLGTGLLYGIAFGIVFGIVGGGFTSGLFGLLSGVGLGLVSGFQSGFNPVPTFELRVDTVSSPVDLLRINRIKIIQFLLIALGCYLVFFGLVYVFEAEFTTNAAIESMSWFMAISASWLAMLVSSTAWGSWLLITRLWLPATGKLPWPIMAFLVDAHRRGVLRQAGGVYRYRHARLRDRLAASQPTDLDGVQMKRAVHPRGRSHG